MARKWFDSSNRAADEGNDLRVMLALKADRC